MIIVNLSKIDIQNLSLKIRNDIFKSINTYKTTIFLGGANLKLHSKLRHQIANVIKSSTFSPHFDIIYPEDVFEELLYGSKKSDLLSLENILAESVDAIILIPESPLIVSAKM